MTTTDRSIPTEHVRETSASYRLGQALRRLIPYLILTAFSLLALFPIYMIVMNSFKARRFIFGDPFALPGSETFSLIGYETVFNRADFMSYFMNSTIITLSALALTLLIGAMAAFALSEYDFRGNRWMALYLSLGIMIPIRLGTVGILRLMVALDLVNSLTGLVLVYIAQALPLTIFILTAFMQQVPKELKAAARIDGASEYRIFWLVLPLVRPALGAIGIFTMIPIWNDLWFPLILAPSRDTATITLGTQQFLGQFVSDWNAVLSSLSLAMVPILIFYLIFSRQMIRSITAGAIK
jgi:raffinose/stachyose/melibiose transport system permease protein